MVGPAILSSRTNRQGDDQQGQQQQVYQGPLQAGDYNIRNSYAGTALDLSEASPEDCTPIIGYHVNNAPNQSWRLISRATGYVLQNVATDTYLGFPLGERPQDGVLISGNQNSVEWKITQGKYGYQIHLADKSNLVLELIDGFDDNYPVDGAKVCLRRSNKSGKSQFWQISPV
ncbi:hypothetical protein FRB99_006092 [Tulasnella sp. 403]|nr:hypothetical protein FRB99_006092 [Tulasnella sp. 403]